MRNCVYIFLILVSASSCQKPPAPLPPSQVMNLSALDPNGNPLGPTGIAADNYTYAKIMDTLVDISVLDTTTTVTFTTDNGSFSTGGTTYAAKFDQTGKAYAFLKNKLPTAAHVQAAVGTTYTLSLTVPFQIAWPDSIYLGLPNEASDSLGSRVSFTTKLLLPLGTPSIGLQVGFYATDINNNRVGTFNNITPSDSTGSVNAQFWILDPTYTGFESVTGYVVVSPGDTIKGKNLILITK
jgi:hypothetical protein